MKFNELYSLLLEMPLRIDPIEIEDREDNQYFNKYNNYEKIGEFRSGKDMIDVFIHTSSYRTKNKIYSLVYNDRKIATYSGTEIRDGITTVMVNSYGKKYNLKGLMYYFYIFFLLKKYKFILSDDALTEKAFGFWNYNFNNFIKQGFLITAVEYGVSNQSIKEIKQLNSGEEMKEFYGTIIDKPLLNKIRYMISH